MLVEHADGDRGPLFFLSYARTVKGPTGVGPDQHVRQFFHDLTENVGQLVYRGAAVPPGFMDQKMRAGAKWPDELMHAVGTCKVLVALLSPRYLRSEWCRREWDAFAQCAAQPQEERASSWQPCIVPVLWAPLHEDLPEHISLMQLFSPDSVPEPAAPDRYRENGVFGLMRMSYLRESYEIVAWQLAMRIADIFHKGDGYDD